MKQLLALTLATLTLLLFASCGVVQQGTGGGTTDDSPETTTGADLVFEDRDETVYTTDRVNIRTSPSSATTANIVTTLAKGLSLKRTGYTASWSRVEYEGSICYISSLYLSLTPSGSSGGNTEVNIEFERKDDTVYVKAGESINVRTAPSLTDSEVLFTATEGFSVKRTGLYLEDAEEGTGWIRIEYEEDGETITAYSRSWYWTTEKPDIAPESTDTTA